MNTPGFTAECSLVGTSYIRGSGVPRRLGGRGRRIEPASFGDFEDCVQGCPPLGANGHGVCAGACEILLGPPGTANGAGGGSPACWPSLSGCFKFGNQWKRLFTRPNCTATLIPC